MATLIAADSRSNAGPGVVLIAVAAVAAGAAEGARTELDPARAADRFVAISSEVGG